MKKKSLKYLWDHFGELSEKAERETGASRLRLMLDWAGAYIVHGCTFTDYFLYEFYRLNHLGRREFVTLRRMKPIIRKDLTLGYGMKDEFLARYDAYVRRDWIGRNLRNTREDFDRFCDKHGACIVKPRNNYGGEGIRRVEIRPDTREELWRELTGEDKIAEELIVQCPEMARLHPESVNTVRPLTLKGKFVAATLRMGVGGAFVDNGSAGGIFAMVDVDTGIVISQGATVAGRRFLRHPTTGVTIPGFQIPQWDKVKELVEEVTAMTPELVAIGWDVAITSDGPVLVEGNDHPGPQIMQGGGPKGMYRYWKQVLRESR